MRRTHRNLYTIGLFVFVGLVQSKAARAGDKINIEGSWRYNQVGCWTGPISNVQTAASNFMNGMFATPNSAGYSFGQRWTESTSTLVWASDFYDYGASGDANDSDHLYFDKPGTAISYYMGHGICGWNGDTTVNCASNSQCQQGFTRGFGLPNGTVSSRSNFGTVPGLSTIGFCRGQPGDTVGTCSYPMWNSRAMALSDCTHPTSRQGLVGYGSGQVRWGDSPNSGSWAGAGTDGGTNLVVIEASCAEMSKRPNEIWPAFAGVHLVATTMVHQGDAYISSIRGQLLAQEYQNNPFSSVSDSWLRAMNGLGAPGVNARCTNAAGTGYNWGVGGTVSGGYGTNGCGGHTIQAMGASSTEAFNHQTENWYGLRLDTNDGKGNGWYNYRQHCNWNCSAWPMDRP